MQNRWIQKSKPKKGALSRQLGITIKDDIPVSLLEAIKKFPVGTTIHNNSGKGKPIIKVTPLLKKRANLALTLKRF